MNLYGFNNSLFDLGFSDASLIESISSSHQMLADRKYMEREEDKLLKISNSILKSIERHSSPPKRRHDGTSPLPLGMDWSPPPRNWDGPNTIWPHDFHTGWSYCVTVPSWNLFAESRDSEPVVFYRVQIGLQSPEGVTITHEVLKRFSDFLKLSSDLKRSFHNKKLPPAPPKGLLRMKSRTLLEERRCSLEAWITKVLSDIDFSRSAPVACFLELEAAARSSFRESSHHLPNAYLSCNNNSSLDQLSSQSDVSMVSGPSALTSIEPCSDKPSEISTSCEICQDGGLESAETSEVQQPLVTSKSDIEDLISRLNTVRQYLPTKDTDLETEFESMKQISKKNLEQAISVERGRFTQMEWDMEELRRKCTEMEIRFKAEQANAEATKTSIIEENEALLQELDSTGEQLKNLQRCHEEADLKSKSDAKLEVKSVRRSQSELLEELDRVSKEKMDFEMRLQEERTKRESVDAANRKLLHECEIFRGRLEECSVNFLSMQENNLKLEFPPDALDILATSDDCIGLLLEEAKLLEQDIAARPASSSIGSDESVTTDNELRKMLVNVLIDNAILRKQANSAFRSALDNKQL